MTLQDDLYTVRQQRTGLGPAPVLSIGTGRTAAPTMGTEWTALSPSYVPAPEYEIRSSVEYSPPWNEDRVRRIPRAIDAGFDGRAIVGTWKAHDFTPVQRDFFQMRSVPNWQEQAFPIGYRQLLQYQQARRYVVTTPTQSSMPLSRNSYSLGYVTTPEVASQIGMNALGYLGSK